MTGSRKRDALLLIPAGVLVLSVAGPVAASVWVPSDSGTFGFGGTLAFIVTGAIAAPFFLGALVWLLIALFRRRPVRDPVGWVLSAGVSLLSVAILGIAWLFSATAQGEWALWTAVVVGSPGALGLFVVALALFGWPHTTAALVER
jgi:hypothetical protein